MPFGCDNAERNNGDRGKAKEFGLRRTVLLHPNSLLAQSDQKRVLFSAHCQGWLNAPLDAKVSPVTVRSVGG